MRRIGSQAEGRVGRCKRQGIGDFPGQLEASVRKGIRRGNTLLEHLAVGSTVVAVGWAASYRTN